MVLGDRTECFDFMFLQNTSEEQAGLFPTGGARYLSGHFDYRLFSRGIPSVASRQLPFYERGAFGASSAVVPFIVPAQIIATRNRQACSLRFVLFTADR